MKTLIAAVVLAVLAATSLAGCVIAPAYPGAGVYVAPAPVVVYRPYYYYRHW